MWKFIELLRDPPGFGLGDGYVRDDTVPVFCLHGFSVAQSCLILCDPVDCSRPGSFVLGILQARVLEWVAMSSSRGSSQTRDGTHISVSCIGRGVLYHSHHLGSPFFLFSSLRTLDFLLDVRHTS